MASSVLVMLYLAWRIWQQLKPDDARYVVVIMAVIALVAPLVGPFMVARFDAFVTALAVTGLFLVLRERPMSAAVVIGFAGACKLWPMLLLPFLCLLYLRIDWRLAFRFGLYAMLAFALPHGVMLAWGTQLSDIFGYLHYMGARPAQIESLTANLQVLYAHLTGTPVAPEFSFGSNNIAIEGREAWLKVALSIHIAGALTLVAFAWRYGPAPSAPLRDHYLFSVACGTALLALTLLCAKVFSGEYVIWFAPLVVILAVRKEGCLAAVAFIIALVLLKLGYKLFDGLIYAQSTTSAVVSFSKNLSFLAVLILSVVIARRLGQVTHLSVAALPSSSRLRSTLSSALGRQPPGNTSSQ